MISTYLNILDFLKQYSGNQYKKIDKCISEDERNYMLKASEDGKNARAKFTSLVDLIESMTGFEHERISQWQNSGTFVSYIWCQMKRPDLKESRISLSLFAEKAKTDYRYRISVEIETDRATEEDNNKYKHLLDLPLEDSLVYVSGGNNESEFRVLNEHDNNVVKNLNLNKVQVSFIITESEFIDDASFEENLLNAAKKLVKYYDYLFSDKEVNETIRSVEKGVDWWPSISEYDPGLSKEQWLELLNDGTTFTENALSAFAAMYDFGGTATCVQLENQYGKTSDFYRMAMGVHVPDKIHKKLGIPFCVEDEKEWLWPIPFVGRSAGKDEPGKYVWKLRSELYDALEEFDITRFLSNKGTEKPMPSLSTKEIIETIKKYIASKGFTYEDGVIENFYLSLKSKPFVILAGTSGTGKSKLVELFAEAIGADYLPVAVRPDWSDSSDLFGHLNLNGKYVKGAIFDFIYEAQVNLGKPYILCMDEMNLARVEYYLSDFLSIIETRKDVDGSIITKPLVSDANYGEDNDTREKYGELVFPENLYLVGTVNMDETTFPFSKKVLDRANTIEFDYVDLLPQEENVSETVDALEVSNDFLKTKYLLLNQ